MPRWLLILPLILTAACAGGGGGISAVTQAPANPSSASANWEIFKITQGGSGGVDIYSELREVNGRLALCGAIAPYLNNSASLYNESFVRDVYARVGDTVVANSVAFFNRIPGRAALGQVACGVTGLPWQPGYAGQQALLIPRQITVKRGGFYSSRIVRYQRLR
ncbi:hypothetical protein [Oceanomicrobium pacificus]|uniref:Lipoprotein n=1 Tax=Oceanomicrobium pacificus TaxID=2692916 RepID=A0A6B0TLK4_9RHOB|nr:hypothetical protein [Oceanomicrobium pacificus]MXU65397.1 hypothetical protein [Oceanomicrobium pacificus]